MVAQARGTVAVNRDTPAPRKVSPLPVRQLMILAIVLLTESICSTMLIPFVGYYVSFMTGWPVEEAGYSAGFLVSAFMAGQILSSKMWGTVAERCGRKVAIACGVSACACAVCMFGLSTNVYACAFWRFIHGLSAGCSLVAKTMIADVTDRTNQAKGFALVSLTWGVGTLIGPALGGWFYDPAPKSWLGFLHLSRDGFFASHPALLPALVACAYNSFAVCVCVLFLKETNKGARPLYMFLPRFLAKALRPLLRVVQPRLPGYDIDSDEFLRGTRKPEVTEVTIVSEPAGHSGGGGSGGSTNSDAGPETELGKAAPCSQGHGSGSGGATPATSVAGSTQVHESFGFKQAFQQPNIRRVLLMSMLISCSEMTYTEIFPLWSVASREHGGLGLTTSMVGLLVLVNSIPAVIANIFYPTVLGTFQSETAFWGMCQTFYAMITLLVPYSSSIKSADSAFAFTMAVGMVRKVSETWTFATLMLVVAQTAPPGRVAVMYGVQQATACLVRCIVPFTSAPLFAWSISRPHPFPLNHWLLYLLYCIPLGVSIVISRRVVIPEEVVGPSQSSADGDCESEECDSPHGGPGEFMSTESIRNASFATHLSFTTQHTFMGAPEHSSSQPNLLFNNSFAMLANSFATNIVPGGLQTSIMAPLVELSSTYVDEQDPEVSDKHRRHSRLERHHRHRRHGHHHRRRGQREDTGGASTSTATISHSSSASRSRALSDSSSSSSSGSSRSGSSSSRASRDSRSGPSWASASHDEADRSTGRTMASRSRSLLQADEYADPLTGSSQIPQATVDDNHNRHTRRPRRASFFVAVPPIEVTSRAETRVEMLNREDARDGDLSSRSEAALPPPLQETHGR